MTGPAMTDVERMRDALSQALRQWRMYAGLEELRDLSTEDSNEGRIYRDCRAALSASQGSGDVNEQLAEFARWAILEGPFAGCHLEGSDVQDKAERLGLLIKTKYDPDKHGPSDCDAGPGDDWFVFAPCVAPPASDGPVSQPDCAKCERSRFDYIASGCPKLDCPMPRTVSAETSHQREPK